MAKMDNSFHKACSSVCMSCSDPLELSRNHLNPAPSPTALIPLNFSPHLSLLICPVARSLSAPPWLPCLLLPPVPQTALITGVHRRVAGHSRAAMLPERKTSLLSSFLTTRAGMKLRGCGTLAGCHASSFVLLQPPGTELTQLAVL